MTNNVLCLKCQNSFESKKQDCECPSCDNKSLKKELKRLRKEYSNVLKAEIKKLKKEVK